MLTKIFTVFTFLLRRIFRKEIDRVADHYIDKYLPKMYQSVDSYLLNFLPSDIEEVLETSLPVFMSEDPYITDEEKGKVMEEFYKGFDLKALVNKKLG